MTSSKTFYYSISDLSIENEEIKLDTEIRGFYRICELIRRKIACDLNIPINKIKFGGQTKNNFIEFTINPSFRDANIVLPNKKTIQFFDIYKNTFEEIIEKLQDYGFFYSQKCIKNNVDLQFNGTIISHTGYPLLSFDKTGLLNVITKGNPITLVFDGKQFIFSEDEKSNDAQKYIEKYFPSKRITIKDTEGRIPTNLKSVKSYEVEYTNIAKFTQKNNRTFCIEIEIDYQTKISSVKNKLASELRARPDDIILYDTNEEQLFDQNKILNRIQNLELTFYFDTKSKKEGAGSPLIKQNRRNNYINDKFDMVMKSPKPKSEINIKYKPFLCHGPTKPCNISPSENIRNKRMPEKSKYEIDTDNRCKPLLYRGPHKPCNRSPSENIRNKRMPEKSKCKIGTDNRRKPFPYHSPTKPYSRSPAEEIRNKKNIEESTTKINDEKDDDKCGPLDHSPVEKIRSKRMTEKSKRKIDDDDSFEEEEIKKVAHSRRSASESRLKTSEKKIKVKFEFSNRIELIPVKFNSTFKEEEENIKDTFGIESEEPITFKYINECVDEDDDDDEIEKEIKNINESINKYKNGKIRILLREKSEYKPKAKPLIRFKTNSKSKEMKDSDEESDSLCIKKLSKSNKKSSSKGYDEAENIKTNKCPKRSASACRPKIKKIKTNESESSESEEEMVTIKFEFKNRKKSLSVKHNSTFKKELEKIKETFNIKSNESITFKYIKYNDDDDDDDEEEKEIKNINENINKYKGGTIRILLRKNDSENEEEDSGDHRMNKKVNPSKRSTSSCKPKIKKVETNESESSESEEEMVTIKFEFKNRKKSLSVKHNSTFKKELEKIKETFNIKSNESITFKYIKYNDDDDDDDEEEEKEIKNINENINKYKGGTIRILLRKNDSENEEEEDASRIHITYVFEEKSTHNFKPNSVSINIDSTISQIEKRIKKDYFIDSSKEEVIVKLNKNGSTFPIEKTKTIKEIKNKIKEEDEHGKRKYILYIEIKKKKEKTKSVSLNRIVKIKDDNLLRKEKDDGPATSPINVKRLDASKAEEKDDIKDYHPLFKLVKKHPVRKEEEESYDDDY